MAQTSQDNPISSQSSELEWGLIFCSKCRQQYTAEYMKCNVCDCSYCMDCFQTKILACKSCFCKNTNLDQIEKQQPTEFDQEKASVKCPYSIAGCDIALISKDIVLHSLNCPFMLLKHIHQKVTQEVKATFKAGINELETNISKVMKEQIEEKISGSVKEIHSEIKNLNSENLGIKSALAELHKIVGTNFSTIPDTFQDIKASLTNLSSEFKREQSDLLGNINAKIDLMNKEYLQIKEELSSLKSFVDDSKKSITQTINESVGSVKDSSASIINVSNEIKRDQLDLIGNTNSKFDLFAREYSTLKDELNLLKSSVNDSKKSITQTISESIVAAKDYNASNISLSNEIRKDHSDLLGNFNAKFDLMNKEYSQLKETMTLLKSSVDESKNSITQTINESIAPTKNTLQYVIPQIQEVLETISNSKFNSVTDEFNLVKTLVQEKAAESNNFIQNSSTNLSAQIKQNATEMSDYFRRTSEIPVVNPNQKELPSSQNIEKTQPNSELKELFSKYEEVKTRMENVSETCNTLKKTSDERQSLWESKINSFESKVTQHFDSTNAYVSNAIINALQSLAGSNARPLPIDKEMPANIVRPEIVPRALGKDIQLADIKDFVLYNLTKIAYINSPQIFNKYRYDSIGSFQVTNYGTFINEDRIRLRQESSKNFYSFYFSCSEKSLHIKDWKTNDSFSKELYKTSDITDAEYYQGKIYICGGKDNNYLDACAILNLESRQIDNSKHLFEKKSGISLVSTSNNLYCLGGFNGISCVSTCESYDNQNGKWSKANPLNNSNSEITTSYDSATYIYIFGGNFKDTYERLNVSNVNNKWEILNPGYPSLRRYGCAFLLSENEFLVFGGNFSKDFHYYLFNLTSLKLQQLSNQFYQARLYSSRPFYKDGFIYIISESEKKIIKINGFSLNYEKYDLNF